MPFYEIWLESVHHTFSGELKYSSYLSSMASTTKLIHEIEVEQGLIQHSLIVQKVCNNMNWHLHTNYSLYLPGMYSMHYDEQ